MPTVAVRPHDAQAACFRDRIGHGTANIDEVPHLSCGFAVTLGRGVTPSPAAYQASLVVSHQSSKDSSATHCSVLFALPVYSPCLRVVSGLHGVSEHLSVDLDVVDVLSHGSDGVKLARLVSSEVSHLLGVVAFSVWL
jgi:D-serine dehydratase